MGLRVKPAMTEMRKIGFLEVPSNNYEIKDKDFALYRIKKYFE